MRKPRRPKEPDPSPQETKTAFEIDLPYKTSAGELLEKLAAAFAEQNIDKLVDVAIWITSVYRVETPEEAEERYIEERDEMDRYRERMQEYKEFVRAEAEALGLVEDQE